LIYQFLQIDFNIVFISSTLCFLGGSNLGIKSEIAKAFCFLPRHAFAIVQAIIALRISARISPNGSACDNASHSESSLLSIRLNNSFIVQPR